MNNLNELKKAILKDGIIDEAEVDTLREMLYADGEVDRQEADFLFELNDAVSGKANSPEWTEFFVEAISSYLLDDQNSPNEIDDEEAEWLRSKIEGDGKLDDTERALIDNLKKKAKNFPKFIG
jgi:uncharacterized membrane protein YebE (DUF533 family)